MIRAIVRVFLFFVFRIRVFGRENLPDGGVIVAANHRSNWDPVIMGVVAKRKLKFMAKSELFKTKLSNWFFRAIGAFPIERGKGDIGAIKTSIRLLQNGEALLMFPEGSRHKDEELGAAKTGAVMIANRARVPIVPVYISGKIRWMGKLVVNFGEPIDITGDGSEKLTKEEMQDMANTVFSKMKDLKVV